MAKKQDTKAEIEKFEIYEDEEGNEFILVDGEYVPFDSSEYELVEEDEGEDEEVFEVYEDEDGEYILMNGERVPFNADEFEEIEIDEDEDTNGGGEDVFNPFMYDNMQAATDVANDIARSGAGIAREGAALAGEMKEAMDDIKSMLDFKSLLK